MKNLILSLFALCLLASCDLGKEPEITGTNTQDMAGEWLVYLMQDGTPLAEDFITTTNTAANLGSEMWLIDENIAGIQVKLATNQDAKTLSCNDATNLFYTSPDGPTPEDMDELGTEVSVYSDLPETVTVENGHILIGAAHVPSGTTADSIHFEITFNYHLDVYRASNYIINGTDTTMNWEVISSGTEADGPYEYAGHNRTGFLEDEPH